MTRAELDQIRHREQDKAHRRAMYRAAWKATQDSSPGLAKAGAPPRLREWTTVEAPPPATPGGSAPEAAAVVEELADAMAGLDDFARAIHAALSERGALGRGALAHAMGVTKARVVGALGPLFQRRLVRIGPPDEDGLRLLVAVPPERVAKLVVDARKAESIDRRAAGRRVDALAEAMEAEILAEQQPEKNDAHEPKGGAAVAEMDGQTEQTT